MIKVLLSHDLSLLEISKSNGKNALHFAARQGHVDIANALLDKEPQLVRRTDKKGQTALHMAVKGHSWEVVKVLVNADTSLVKLPDKFGNLALHVATRKKRTEVCISITGSSQCLMRFCILIRKGILCYTFSLFKRLRYMIYAHYVEMVLDFVYQAFALFTE